MDPKINGRQVFSDLLFLNKYQSIRNVRGSNEQQRTPGAVPKPHNQYP